MFNRNALVALLVMCVWGLNPCQAEDEWRFEMAEFPKGTSTCHHFDPEILLDTSGWVASNESSTILTAPAESAPAPSIFRSIATSSAFPGLVPFRFGSPSALAAPDYGRLHVYRSPLTGKFTYVEYIQGNANAKVDVIAHGFAPLGLSGIADKKLYVEMFPLLSSCSNSAAGLSLAQLRDILTGKLTSWEPLGGHGEIRLYFHQGFLQQESAKTLLARIGIAPDALVSLDRPYAPTYAALAAAAEQDPQALVLGLQDWNTAVFKPLAIDGHSFPEAEMTAWAEEDSRSRTNAATMTSYPLTLISTMFKLDLDVAGEDPVGTVLTALRQAAALTDPAQDLMN